MRFGQEQGSKKITANECGLSTDAFQPNLQLFEPTTRRSRRKMNNKMAIKPQID